MSLPTTEQLLQAQVDLRARQSTWLERCRELAELRMPAPMYARVPKGAWRVSPWGHKIIVAHAPPVKRYGNVHMPSGSQEKTAYGWVLSVGESICQGESRQAPPSGVCPYGDPLLLVGEFILFQRFSVNEFPLGFNATDVAGHEKDGLAVSLMSISAVHMPVIQVDPSDWAEDQPSRIVGV